MPNDFENHAGSHAANPYSAPESASRGSGGPPEKSSSGQVIIWSAACVGAAVKLTLSARFLTNPDFPLLLKVWSVLSSAALGLLAGIGAALLARSLLQKRFAMLTPGHWLALTALASLLGVVAAFPWHGQPGFAVGFYAFSMRELVESAVRNSVGTALFVAVSCRTAESKVWRRYAVVTAVLYLLCLCDVFLSLAAAQAGRMTLEALVFALRVTTKLCLWSGRLLFLIGIIQDSRRQKERDYFHWFAIVVTIALPVIAVVLGVT